MTGDIRNYIYIYPHFDDSLGEYKEGYFRQIDQYLSDHLIPGINLIFRNEYTPFHKAIEMTNATVDNES